MRTFLSFFTLILVITGCNPVYPDMNETVSLKGIVRVPIPFREHGYSELVSKIIVSKQGLDKFLEHVKRQSAWNNKLAFLKTFEYEKIDFSRSNLVFYRLSESSGSIGLEIVSASVEGSHADIQITRSPIPDGMAGTADMAYYMLAYIVDKSVKILNIQIGNQEIKISNKKSDMIVPENCMAWFDGCNNCMKTMNNTGVCTEIACLVYRPQDFRCTKWE